MYINNVCYYLILILKCGTFNLCGIFLFDLFQDDMPYLRWWRYKLLIENLQIEGYGFGGKRKLITVFWQSKNTTTFTCLFFRHGRRFAHFTPEGLQMSSGYLAPIFRIPRKRKQVTKVWLLSCEWYAVHFDALCRGLLTLLLGDIFKLLFSYEKKIN